jgi:hypothetical protein
LQREEQAKVLEEVATNERKMAVTNRNSAMQTCAAREASEREALEAKAYKPLPKTR